MPVTADDLVDHLIESHLTSGETNACLRELTGRMDRFFASKLVRGLSKKKKDGVRDLWNTYLSPTGGPAANVRMATLDLRDFTLLRQTSQDPRKNDGSGPNGNTTYSQRPPVYFALDTKYRDVIDLMRAYLTRLLDTELSAVRALTLEAAQMRTSNTYRPIVSVDYYSDRSTATSALHKDTTGNTLFVALHYVNRDRMLGPEYIHDTLALKVDGERVGGPRFMQFHDDEDDDIGVYGFRFYAPWKKHAGGYYWPIKFLRVLEEARGKLDNAKVIHHVTLNAYGLVSFVDELVYHATPYGKPRSDEDKKSLFKHVEFNGNPYRLEPLRQPFTRRFSQRYDEGELSDYTMTGGEEKRCFIRLWFSIVREDWYAPLT